MLWILLGLIQGIKVMDSYDYYVNPGEPEFYFSCSYCLLYISQTDEDIEKSQVSMI